MDAPLPTAMSVEDLNQWRAQQRPYALLDVREPRELAVCSIAGALHVPMQQVPERLKDLPHDVPLVVMCHHGMRSRMVTQFLRGQGYANAINLEGGIDAWAALVEPGMARY